jgi:predicted flap endonuclease-1-like 5' DNA nuclease
VEATLAVLDILLVVVGLGVGAAVASVWTARASDRRVAEIEGRGTAALEQARREALDADLAHRETKERLVQLQIAHERLKATASFAAVADEAPAAAKPGGPPRGGVEDLKRIRGIGPSLERRLRDLGITSVTQIATLSAAEIERIDRQLDFPGRIRRERWVEQARALLGH